MALTVLPIDSSSPNYTVDIELSNQLFRFTVLWNSRDESWILGMFDTEDNPIIRSINIRTNFELFRNYTDSRLPVGNIFCIDTTDSGLEPTLDNLGDTHIVIYDDLIDG